MAFRIHSPGSCSLLVDLGRPHHRSLGVSVGGAADRTAFLLGNALVGNPPDTVALEISLAGPTLEATATHACVLTGAAFQLFINDQPNPTEKTFIVRGGDIVTISTAQAGLRGYFCVPGGFESRITLDSRSAWAPLRAGQELACAESTLLRRFVVAVPTLPSDRGRLRVLRGTHADLFAEDGLTGQVFHVTAESNRMGLRLSGKPLTRPAGEMLSAPVCPGTVQISNDGQPIVLGVEAQTIGGYPRIAHVISADLDRVAQLCPGDSVEFACVDLPRAVELHRQHHAWLREWVTRLRASVL